MIVPILVDKQAIILVYLAMCKDFQFYQMTYFARISMELNYNSLIY